MQTIDVEMLDGIMTDRGMVYIGLDPFMEISDIKAQGYTPLLVRVKRVSNFKESPYGTVIREAKSFFSNEYPKKGELYYTGDSEKYKEKHLYPLLEDIRGKSSEEYKEIKRSLDNMIDVLREIEECGSYQLVRVSHEGEWYDVLDKKDSTAWKYAYKYYIAIQEKS